jgi:alginate O-acetyltransferase complex protein AlgI
MLFNSIEFLFFFAIVLLCYYRLAHKMQNVFLLAASFIFYGWWDWRFLILMMSSIFVDYQCGRQMANHPERRKLALLFSITFNMGILGFFKYFNFFAESFSDLIALFGMHLDGLTLHVILPVGISFYTFQSMGYCIDCYQGKLKPSNSLLEYALYVSFFPQLVAGPIEKAHHLLVQVQKPRIYSESLALDGLWLMVLGYLKKVVIADRCAQIVDPCFAGTALPEFSGYTDIARGIAKILGFDLMKNFGKPYLVADPSEFWQNWHISLSTWLREYLYFGLGGNKNGEFKTYRNLMLTMAIGGLWHGAGWAYFIWGLYQGVVLVVFRMFGRKPARREVQFRHKVLHILAVIVFFHITCLGWLIFRVGSLPKGHDQIGFLGNSLKPLFSTEGTLPLNLLRVIIPMLLLTFLCQSLHEVMERFSQWSLFKRGLALASCLVAIACIGVFDGSGFIYFQF